MFAARARVGFRGAAIALFAVGCTEHGSIVVHMSSTLEIPRETDTLLVRLLNRQSSIRDQSYELGPFPRDQWPQLLPIVSDGGALKKVTIAAELRRASGLPLPLLVGYSAVDADFPVSGSSDVDLDVLRACDSADGFGSGAGCKGPRPTPVPMDQPDAGTGAPADGSAPPPTDASNPGPGMDATAASNPDASVVLEPDAGPAPACVPAEGPCAAGETCYQNHCHPTCDNMNPCRDPNFAFCMQPEGICACTLSCDQNGMRCYPFTCQSNGCCKLQ